MAKLYSRKNVLAIVPLSATTIWRLEKSHDFPQRKALSPGKICYDATEVDKWIESRQLATGSGLRGEVV